MKRYKVVHYSAFRIIALCNCFSQRISNMLSAYPYGKVSANVLNTHVLQALKQCGFPGFPARAFGVQVRM